MKLKKVLFNRHANVLKSKVVHRAFVISFSSPTTTTDADDTLTCRPLNTNPSK